MIHEDWRDAASGLVERLLAAEEQRWGAHLGWDVGPALRQADEARRAGVLPGVVVRSRAGEPLALSFFDASHGVVRIRALTGTSAGALRLMLDLICLSPEAQLATGLTCLVFPTTTSAASALARQRFALESRPYLSLSLASCPRLSWDRGPVRAWVTEDVAPVTRLLARAYTGDREARCYAYRGRLDEWARYAAQLLQSPLAGTFEPAWSFVAESHCEFLGAVLCTRVSPVTAHIAQVVTDPAHRRRGVASGLLGAACRAARQSGIERITIHTSEQNAGTRALAAHMGFLPTAWSFLYAHRGPIARRVKPLDPESDASIAEPAATRPDLP
jgi:ribosomal protein S18 acetylase RimI-like enzyme